MPLSGGFAFQSLSLCTCNKLLLELPGKCLIRRNSPITNPPSGSS